MVTWCLTDVEMRCLYNLFTALLLVLTYYINRLTFAVC